MKRLLTRLTLGLVTVIVVVLAGYLILIARSLIRANGKLAKLVQGLEAIRDNTAPLDHDLTTINRAATTLRDGLTSADGNLQTIVRVLRDGRG